MCKPYVICHMMASVDGRIDCAMTEKIETGDEYYVALKELDVPTTLCGRTTAALHYALPGIFKPHDAACTAGREIVFKALDSDSYSVVVDTHGTLLWDKSTLDGNPMICITGGQVSQEYLDYLRNKGISYIAVGCDGIDLPRAMEILADTFGVKRLGVVGGGKINASFLASGLIDEISLMIAPGVDGRNNQPSVFDGLPDGTEPFKLRMTDVKVYGSGVVWIKYKAK